MALIFADRVRERVSAAGAGTWTLAGASSGDVTFLVGIGDGNTCYYAAKDGSGNWEVGLGTYTASGNTLARTTILASSSGGSVVTFASPPTVWNDLPAKVIASSILAGSNTQIQYNDNGVMAASAAMTFNKSTGVTTFSPGAPDFNGGFIVNFNSATPPQIPHQYSIRVVAADGGVGALYLHSWAGGGATGLRSILNGYFSRGTCASPLAVQNGDELFRISGRAYDGTGYTASVAAVSFIAGENFVHASNQGSWIGFRTTALGTTGGGSETTPPVTSALCPSGGFVVGAGAVTVSSPNTCTLNRDPGSGFIQAMSGFMLTGSTLADTITLKGPAFTGQFVITLPAGTTDFSGTGGAHDVVKQSSVGAALTVGQLTQADVLGSGVSTLWPAADSTSAIQFLKADGATFVAGFDTTNIRLGIGVTSPAAALDIYTTAAGTAGGIKIVADNNTGGRINLSRFGASGAGPSINLSNSRGTSASPTTSVAGDFCGALTFGGSDVGGVGRTIASVVSVVGAIGASSNDISGYVVVNYRPTGIAASTTEGMRLSATGGLTVGNSTFNTTDPGQGCFALQGTEVIGGNGAASVAQTLWSGTLFTGGSTTTNFPAMFVQSIGTTAVTTWSANGTVFGINAPNAFAGNFVDCRINGSASLLKIDSAGGVTSAASLSGSFLQAAATGNIQWAGRGIISSPVAATVHIGSADSSSPVAQTFGFQGVVAGTSNTSGQNAVIAGSIGTGTGVGGSLIFQVAPAGTTGTTQNALATALTIDGATKRSIFANGIADSGAAPSIAANTGAGGSPSIAIAGGPIAGRITLTTGTLPVAGATVATITYGAAFGTDSFVVLTPGNANAAGLSGVTMVFANGSANSFLITSGATGLAAATQYIWNYHIAGK